MRRHSTARAKLLRALLEEEELDWDLVTHKLGVSGSVIRAMEESGVVKVIRETQYRNPVSHLTSRGYGLTLNDEQQEAVDAVWSDYEKGIRSTYLIKGVTGSGKTEVYMELIAKMQKAGLQAIVLIPEIALTYQTVLRFYNRFGDRVSILNSRMSPGSATISSLGQKRGDRRDDRSEVSTVYTVCQSGGLSSLTRSMRLPIRVRRFHAIMPGRPPLRGQPCWTRALCWDRQRRRWTAITGRSAENTGCLRSQSA